MSNITYGYTLYRRGHGYDAGASTQREDFSFPMPHPNATFETATGAAKRLAWIFTHGNIESMQDIEIRQVSTEDIGLV